MSKKFKGKKCVFCSGGVSTKSGDHIFARKFFLESRRGNLPKVPCCKPCNDEKSRLEHYLTAVLPFGAIHADSLENLTTLVPPRLNKNIKLHQNLYLQQGGVFVRDKSGLMVPQLTIPIETDQILALFDYITKALANHHFGIKSHENVFYQSTLEMPDINSFYEGKSKSKVSENLGNGTILYRGVQATDNDHVSAWEYTFYGGLNISNTNSSKIVTLTGPEQIQESARLRRKFSA